MKKENFINSYKGKNVYITGITGYKGTWLALMLHHLGANVYGIGREPKVNDPLYYDVELDDIAKVTIGHLTEPATNYKLISSLLKANPDYIFHLAKEEVDPNEYNVFNRMSTNVMGTVALHEVIRGLRLPANISQLNEGNRVRFSDEAFTCKKISIVNAVNSVDEKDLTKLSLNFSESISKHYRDNLNSPHLISTITTGNSIGGGEIDEEFMEVISNLRNSDKTYEHVFDSLTAILLVGMKQHEIKGDDYVSKEGYDKLLDLGWNRVYNNELEIVSSITEWYNKYVQGLNVLDSTLLQIETSFEKY